MLMRLKRGTSHGPATLGKLTAGDFGCDTLEDVVREQPGIPVANWKVHGRTAIPAGTYKVIAEDSPRFGPDTLTLLDVPGFRFIRIHAGNTHEDTEGCILVGRGRGEDSLLQSRSALNLLKETILPLLLEDRDVYIEIENPGRDA